MDEVLTNLLDKILPMYNKDYNDNLTLDKITQYEMKPFIKPECKNLFEEYVDDKLYESLDVVPNAVEVLTELAKNHDVYFATAGHPYTMRARDNWLTKTFSFYRTGSLISIREKPLLRVDFLVDDYEENLIGGHYYGLLVDKPYNKDFPERLYRIKRIFDIAEVPKIIRDFEKAV